MGEIREGDKEVYILTGLSIILYSKNWRTHVLTSAPSENSNRAGGFSLLRGWKQIHFSKYYILYFLRIPDDEENRKKTVILRDREIL
jgi:hypothetical protein